MDSEKATYKCDECGKVYSRRDNLLRHTRSAHEGKRFVCDKCSKSYKRNKDLEKHKCAALSQPLTEYQCSKCPEIFASPRELAVHFRRFHPSASSTPQPGTSRPDTSSPLQQTAPSPPPSRTYTCRTCHQHFEGRSSLYRHQHTGSGKERQPTPWSEEGAEGDEGTEGDERVAAPWVDRNTGEVTEPALRDAYELNADAILAHNQPGEVASMFNVPLHPNFSIGELMERARHVYQSLDYSLRLNIAFGFILRNVETGQYRYFHPYSSNPLFTSPLYITEYKDLEQLRQRLASLDISSFLMKQREDTKWKPVLITNVQFYTYRSNFPLGHTPVTLPDYIKNHKAIISLDCNDRGKPYQDQLCAFRCLALYRDPSARASLETPTKILYKKWVDYSCQNHLPNIFRVAPEDYEGLSPSLLSDFEACFGVNVSVFQLDEDRIAQPAYKTRGVFQEHMYLNLYEKHLSLITNIYVYCKRYRCPICSMLFKRKDKCNRHQRGCSGQTKLRFPGGFHRTPKTVFDELSENNLKVDESERFFPWFIVYDFECSLSPIDSGTDKLRWMQEHHPISVSICSNVEGFTSPRCIVDADVDQLIAAMLEYMTEIADKVSELACEKWSLNLGILRSYASDKDKNKDRIGIPSAKQSVTQCDVISDVADSVVTDFIDVCDDNESVDMCDDDVSVDMCDDDDSSDESSDEESGAKRVGKDDKTKTPEQLRGKRMSYLYEKLSGYCSQVPVLGFNSARYDLNIIKEKLPKHLSLDSKESHAFTVKKNNSYLCQSNDTFKFLDVTQYLSPGTSYAQFLKAFGVTEKKGFFPYEYLDTPNKLDETRLPPLGEAWYSSLKQKSVLDDGLKSIEENYAELEAVWEREGMTTFRDFLVWYNNLDVGPFVQAAEAMQRFYNEDGIDLFKTTMSVPGVARQKLFRESQKEGVTFALFDKSNVDLYDTVKANVVGGPSIIFTRYHKAHQTFIRDNPKKPCKRVVGYDANALYLWAIDQDMPTGPFVRRKAETGFRPERRDRYMSMYYWMDWLRFKTGRDIKHKLNWGREKRVGPYLVDGFVPKSNVLGKDVVLEYYGCYYHGHECYLTQKARGKEKQRAKLAQRLERTHARAAFIRKEGYDIVEKWECDFLKDRKADRELSSFIEKRQPPFYQHNKRNLTEDEILRAVVKGDLFGMVEVDIRVPERWQTGRNPHGTRLSPEEYFREMAPLFCNAEVPHEALGEHMQQYIAENELSKKPRQMLVGGLKARQMLIATPLLQWYLQHGMVITRVYQVVEYTPNACFHSFVEDVCSARRQSDSDPSASIRGDTAKLVGNSAYGSVLINKEKHQTVSYVSTPTEASRQVNLPQFRKLTELGEGYFEVEKGKKLLNLDTPMQLCYFILQYAKLRMLQFYYDFMDVYVDRSDWEYMEMDTDSAYMALSAKCLSDVIQPSKQTAYQTQLTGLCRANPEDDHCMRWFPRTCCSVHALHDKRTPGLFKLEYEGDEMIGLCSKTYLVAQSELQRKPRPPPSTSVRCAERLLQRARRVLGKRVSVVKKTRLRSTTPVVGYFDHRVKFSCKGISKRTLKTPLKAFINVLRTRVPGEGMNRGFRLKGNTMCTYQQTRRGLSYLYCKRRVLDDGIHTAPLDIELCPYPSPRDNTNTLDDTDTFLVEILNELAEN